MSNRLPEPRLTKIFRVEASLGGVLDVGTVEQGRRRIVPLTGGTFSGPTLAGTLLPGASADWQIVLPDGTVLGFSAAIGEQVKEGRELIEFEATKSGSPRPGSPRS